jgi:Protein of unknown function (DUF2934)
MAAIVKISSESKGSDCHESGESEKHGHCEAKIAVLAYYKAERRNFEPGHALDDWLEAEQECSQQ